MPLSQYVLCILSPGRLIKKVGRDVMDGDFVYIDVEFYYLIIYGIYTFDIARVALRPGSLQIVLCWAEWPN